MSGLNAAAQALGANVASALYGVTGAGIKIGIISDSYDANGGAAANVAAGYLPPNATVLSDAASGTDEGQAMTELAYQIAPGASYYFASGSGGIASFAAAVTALQAAGCTIIIDDLAYPTAESFYQTGTVLDQAISAAVSAGVSYFSSAGNDGNDYLQAGFAPTSVTLPGIGQVTANDFGGGNPYLTVSIARGTKALLGLQWAQPFASIGNGPGAANSLALYLLDAQGNIVASSTGDATGADPVQALQFTNTTNSSVFRLVVVENGHTVTPNGQNFTVYTADSGATIINPAAGNGTGTIYGHELLAGTNVVGAVDYGTAPAFGGTPTMATYSSTGPGTIQFSATGTALATPITPNTPSFASVAGTATTVPGFASFNGTSAAAPNAGAVGALMLQANATLTPAEVTALLEQSTIPVVAVLGNSGAGLIQARAAVELSAAAGGTVWTNGLGGNWNTAANWGGAILPGNAGAVMLGNNLGSLTATYTVVVDSAADAAGALTLSAPSGMTVRLSLDAGGSLAVGGPAAGDITAGDFLVAGGGLLAVDQGSLSVSGSLNSNNGDIQVSAGQVTAGDFAQNAGSFLLGGGTAPASLTLTDGTGLAETGGSISIGAEGVVRTGAIAVSASGLSIGTGGTVISTGAMSLADGTLVEGGSLTVESFAMTGGSGTIGSGGVVRTGSLSLGPSATTASLATLTVNGVLVDQGNLDAGGLASGGAITIGQGGQLSLGGSTAAVSLMLQNGGLLDFTAASSAVLTSSLSATINGFSGGAGTIEFGSLTYDPLDTYHYANGLLAIYQGSQPIVDVSLASSETYAGFSLSAGANNSLVVESVACFLAGTRLLTERGAIQVEALRVGDRAMTLEGESAPITWIGRRSLSCHRHPDPAAILPVRVRAHAFAAGKPSRDLYLSPDHAIFAEDVLIPVKYLIDGLSIAQIPAARATYYHIKLDQHDIILAEDLPVESYLDIGEHDHFEGGNSMTLHPTWGEARLDPALTMAAAAYAPLCVTGEEVARVRARLRARHARNESFSGAACFAKKRASGRFL